MKEASNFFKRNRITFVVLGLYVLFCIVAEKLWGLLTLAKYIVELLGPYYMSEDVAWNLTILFTFWVTATVGLFLVGVLMEFGYKFVSKISK